jgi:hypothetical protein
MPNIIRKNTSKTKIKEPSLEGNEQKLNNEAAGILSVTRTSPGTG